MKWKGEGIFRLFPYYTWCTYCTVVFVFRLSIFAQSQVSLLRAHDVEDIFYLESHALQTACTQIVYLVRPLVHTMKLIAEQIHMHAQRDLHKKYTLYFVPRMTYLCERCVSAWMDVIFFSFCLCFRVSLLA